MTDQDNLNASAAGEGNSENANPNPEPEQTLEQRLLKETTGFAIMKGLAAVLTAASFVLVNRLLQPEDTGLRDAVWAYVGAGIVLGQGGLGHTLIRRQREPSELTYRVAFTATVAIAAVLLAVFFTFTELASVTDEQRAVMRAMGWLLIFPCLSLMPTIRLSRALRFGVQGRIALLSQVCRHTIMISLAFAGAGVWALVAGEFAAVICNAVLCFKASPGFVRFGFHRRILRALLGYGAKVQAAYLVLHFRDNVGGGLLGPLVGFHATGLYGRAQDAARLPMGGVNNLARTQFPVYGQLTPQDPRLIKVVRTALRTIVMLGLPILGAVGFGAGLVPIIYGQEKWIGVAAPLVAMLPGMMCELLILPLLLFHQGQGRPGFGLVMLVLWMSSTWLLVVASLGLFPGDLVYVALAQGLASAATVFFLLHATLKRLQFNYAILSGMRAPILSGIAAVGLALLFRWFTAGWALNQVIEPILAALVFLASYVLVLMSFEGRAVFSEIRAVKKSLT